MRSSVSSSVIEPSSTGSGHIDLTASVEIIINTTAGVTDKTLAQQTLKQVFGERGIEPRISIANTGDEVDDLAKQAALSNAQTIVAGGGDGTVSAIASMIAGTGKTLGVLPLGTLNHFAKDLKIPLELEEAARTIIAGHSISIDVAEVNGRIFLNNSSLGLYPRLVRERQLKQALGHGKWPAFLWATISVLRRYPFLDVRLVADGREFATRTPFVFVGNNEYEMEGFNIGSRRRLDDGALTLYVTRRVGRLGLMLLALRALFKELRQANDFVAMTTAELWVETRRKRVRVAIDGETAMFTSPLHFRLLPKALRVIVPSEGR